jgi:hypothetical protein
LSNALAIAVSWLAAGALVIGIAWVASAASKNPPPGTPADTLPLALAWSAASLISVGAGVGCLFAGGRRRQLLLGVAATLAAALVALALVARATAG